MLYNQNKHFYLKSYLRFLALLRLVVILLISVFVFLMAGLLALGFVNAGKDMGLLIMLEVVLGVSGVALCIVLVSTLITETIPLFSARLEVTGEGLEYHCWPMFQLRCEWGDIEVITRRREIFWVDVILLKRAEELGPNMTMRLRKLLGLSTQPFIPLSGLSGWPKGELREILEQKIPHMFALRQ